MDGTSPLLTTLTRNDKNAARTDKIEHMCGIAGLVNRKSTGVDRSLLERMTRRLQHRGPDGEGYYVSGNVGFGHRRLSIIDVSAGHQPMSNEDGSVWVTFNGEIYNFQELRTELKSAGHIFRSHSDTEVIVHGYEQWGEGVVARLRGMFAFGVLDQNRGKLLLARDRFGIKPLVYYDDPERFVFASEIKALHADPAVPRMLDHEALAEYFELGYVPAPKTIFRGISKLKPGHLITLDLRQPGPITQRSYWSLSFEEGEAMSEAQAAEALEALLLESVRIELVSDVPLGAMLSGGVDSSAVVSLMAQASPGRVKTFSIGFEEKQFSEVHYARMVAQANNTEHFEHIVKADIQDLLPRLVYHFDEPFADASAVPTYYLCRMARQNVTVCLSGDGGDEVFAGYERYRHCLGLGKLDFLPLWMRQALFGPLAAMYPSAAMGSTFVQGIARTPDERFVNYMGSQYGSLSKQDLFTRNVSQAGQQGRRDFQNLWSAFDPGIHDALHRYLDVDIKTYLPNDILAKVDITSMMNSLEVRVPLLDHKLVEFVARLPSRFKLKGREGKHIFKRAMQARLPNEVLYRNKMGFGVPMRQWVVGELRDITHDYLLNPSRVSGLLNPQLLRRMVEDNERSLYRSKTGGKLWWALFFEMWHQDVLSGRGELSA